ncbi:TPA: hypothetical protein ACF0RA_002548 [Enterococcus hirae]
MRNEIMTNTSNTKKPPLARRVVFLCADATAALGLGQLLQLSTNHLTNDQLK